VYSRSRAGYGGRRLRLWLLFIPARILILGSNRSEQRAQDGQVVPPLQWSFMIVTFSEATINSRDSAPLNTLDWMDLGITQSYIGRDSTSLSKSWTLPLDGKDAC
jgi:hypothetical protein